MVRRIGLGLCLVALAGFVALPAFAAVQNVKISGDINVSGVARSNLDLDKSSSVANSVGVNSNQDNQSDFLSITRVKVDADLTDNVSTSVRLLSERNWNGDSTSGTTANRNIGLTAAGVAGDENDIDLDLASITLREFMTPALTLTVGRQELRFGNGWIVGDPDTNGLALGSELAEGDLSSRKAFDAIRARLDYNPLVLDIFYAKIAENVSTLNDDTTLGGINAGYELNANTNLEGFIFSKVRGVAGLTAAATGVINVDSGLGNSFDTAKQATDVVNTVGARVVNKSVKNLTLDGQVAYQFGTYNPKLDPNARFVSATDKAETSARSAWGTEVVAVYDLKDVSMVSKYEPSLTGVYVYLSGEGRDKVGNKTYKGWDGMYEDQTFGHLINAVMGFSNVHLAGLSLKAKPASDLTAKLDYISGWFAKRYPEGRAVALSGVSGARQFTMGKTPHFGQEIDLTLNYDYTEDVQLSLLGGVLLPTKAINARAAADPFRQRAIAAELIGSMKVTF